jgi:hypothetical protein
MCIKSKSSTMSNDSPILLRLLGRSWDKFLLIGCCLLAGWMLIMWLLPHWDYLPDWAPVPGPRLMDPLKCVQPIILCGLGLPTLLAFVVGLIANLVLLLNRVLSRHIGGMVVLGVGLMILVLAALPWLFGDAIDDILIRYAITRYDVAIDAIELYHEEHGEYPPSLDMLVPDYLPTVPGIYMKYGEILKYDPNSEWGYVGSGPFTFELYGHYLSLHGQTLKYCPVEDNSCSGFNRIDDRWVWAYASAL